MKQEAKLFKIYNKLLDYFGPQHWWPADSPFEVMVGAILTQSTNWGNVEKAIANLKRVKVLTPEKIVESREQSVERWIKPSGYFRQKARKLRAFAKFFLREYGGRLRAMRCEGVQTLREKLLAVHGIGPETADSILLYALNKPNFVVDAYT